MASRAEELYQKLQDPAAILALIGQSEDLHLDCKEWPAGDDASQQKIFAKAACGFTNAEGGVLVVGMRARKGAEDEPDVVESPRPVADTVAVRSRILDLVGQLVEPGIEGVKAEAISETSGSKSGFVVVLIPPSDGSPRRSRKDWRFFLRIGSGTIAMEYFQIADMFGTRPQPDLTLYLEHDGFRNSSYDTRPQQFFWLGLSNTGRGIAKFPSIRFRRDQGFQIWQSGLDGNGSVGLPVRPSESDWIIFQGGVDYVIFPEETLKITKVSRVFSHRDHANRYVFENVTFSVEVSCENARIKKISREIPMRHHS